MENTRNKAWRQAVRNLKETRRKQKNCKKAVSEKNWKLMYLRSAKLQRAKQLGIDYPSKTLRQVLDCEMPDKERK